VRALSLDVNGWCFIEALALLRQAGLALGHGRLADRAVDLDLAHSPEQASHRFERGSDRFGKAEPRESEMQAGRERRQRQQDHGSSGETERLRDKRRDLVTQHAPGRTRQHGLAAVQAQRGKRGESRHQGHQRQRAQPQRHGVRVVGAGPRRGSAMHEQPPPEPRRPAERGQHWNVGGKAERDQHRVGHPRANASGQVVDLRYCDGIEKARVIALISRQRNGDRDRDQRAGDPARLSQQAGSPPARRPRPRCAGRPCAATPLKLRVSALRRLAVQAARLSARRHGAIIGRSAGAPDRSRLQRYQPLGLTAVSTGLYQL